MKKKDLICSVLRNMGYEPTIDEDGDLMIRYQLKNIWIIIGDENEPYVSVLLSQFHEISKGEETLVLVSCNRVTRDMKMVKVFIDRTMENVSAMCGYYYTDEESLALGLEHSLCIIGQISSVFRKTMHELRGQ